jgi:hypothetical protein
VLFTETPDVTAARIEVLAVESDHRTGAVRSVALERALSMDQQRDVPQGVDQQGRWCLRQLRQPRRMPHDRDRCLMIVETRHAGRPLTALCGQRPEASDLLRDVINNVIEITENVEFCLVYDRPLTYKQKERGGPGPLIRQRMDFLLLFPQRQRIVVEVDGRQHNAGDDGRTVPERYAEMIVRVL